MAKDRFSRFKKSNYDPTQYSMNYVGIGYRDKLLPNQREFILQLIKKCNTEFNKKFLRSILVEDKVPSEKQKIVIKNIIKYNKL